MKVCTMALDVVAVSDCNDDIHCSEFFVNFEEPFLDYATMSILGIHTRRNHVSQGKAFTSKARHTDSIGAKSTSEQDPTANFDRSTIRTVSDPSPELSPAGISRTTSAPDNIIEPEWCDIFCNDQKAPEVMAFIGPDDLLTFFERDCDEKFSGEVKPPTQILNSNCGETKYDNHGNISANVDGDRSLTIENPNSPVGKFTRKPSSTTLKFFHLRKGCNSIICKNRASGATAKFSLYLYGRFDKIIIMDVDGTVTRSDVRGYVESVYLGVYNYTHDGVVTFLNTVQETQGHHVLYLTSRPISHLKETRLLLLNARDTTVGKALPQGPVFSNTESLMTAAYRELIAKNTVALKSSILLTISEIFKHALSTPRLSTPSSSSSHNGFLSESESDLEPFIPDQFFSPFLFGIGNKVADAIAYKMAGVLEGRILIIDPSSTIRVWADKRNAAHGSTFQTPKGDGSDVIEISPNRTVLCPTDVSSFVTYSDPALLLYMKTKSLPPSPIRT